MCMVLTPGVRSIEQVFWDKQDSGKHCCIGWMNSESACDFKNAILPSMTSSNWSHNVSHPPELVPDTWYRRFLQTQIPLTSLQLLPPTPWWGAIYSFTPSWYSCISVGCGALQVTLFQLFIQWRCHRKHLRGAKAYTPVYLLATISKTLSNKLQAGGKETQRFWSLAETTTYLKDILNEIYLNYRICWI